MHYVNGASRPPVWKFKAIDMKGGLVTKTWKHFAFTCAVLGKVMNASFSLAHDTSKFLGLAALMLSVVLLGAGKAATAQPQPEPKPKPNVVVGGHGRVVGPPAQQRVAWRRAMAGAARPKKGCFTSTYPDTKWHEAKCGTPPNRPYKPRGGIRPFTVGNGVDFSAQVTGNTSQAEGSFDSVSPGITENDGGTANSFSLQLNTNFFSTATCAGASVPANCLGWEQFIYASDFNAVFIQYWMINFNNPCPAGWNTFGGDCWRNSTNSATPPAQTIAALGQMVVDGAVAGVGGNPDDAVTFTVGGMAFSASGDNVFPDLTNGWNISEFNVVGDGGGSEATFGAASTITVRTAVNSGMGAVPPTCDQVGFTGETNNLTLVTAPALINDVNWPSIVFTQTNNAPTPISCDNADSIGDTHLKTFAGLYYDFQASGDFVLAQDGPDFQVQARQASGAPTWPNASLNKGIAIQMGKTRVAVYVEPDRLVIDGRAEALADGKDLLLPTGVQVSRRGNLYVISSENGNNVRAVLNGVYIDAHVGLGHGKQQPRGLLGNPNRNVNQLVTAKGVVLTEPVAFTDLYHGYADSWRVQPNQSLFTEVSTIRAGIPSSLFFATHLNPQEFAHARRICVANHITNKTLLDACTLDTAVLNDEAAAKVFVTTRPPLHVVKPVLRATRIANP
jgi:hypothetical protein